MINEISKYILTKKAEFQSICSSETAYSDFAKAKQAKSTAMMHVPNFMMSSEGLRV